MLFRSLSVLILPRLRRFAWRTSITYPNLFQLISAPAIQTVQLVVVIGLEAEVSHILPSSFTNLSSKEPSVLEIYHLLAERRLGINLYADLDRTEKLFASSFTIIWLNQDCTQFLESLVREHGLLSVKHVRYSADSPEILAGMKSVIELMPRVEQPELWNARE